MFNTVKKDIQKYIATDDVKGIGAKIYLFAFNYSLWVIISYRFGRWVRYNFKIPILKQILKIITKILHEILGMITGIQIQFETKIGSGLYIGHTGFLIINSGAVIGENCNLGVGVVIGQGGRGPQKGCPDIGDNVFIGVGAKVIGKIKIGNCVAIGANAVVTKDIPENATAVGIPARVINYSGSKDFIKT
ncbi:MAG: serine acetyltransferase [Candidatus Omnitrophota bacterium]